MGDRLCETCGSELLARHKRFCSKKCYGQFLKENPEKRNHFRKGDAPWNKGTKGYLAGSKHWNWKGGRRKHASGYVEVKCEDHPRVNSAGYVLEHRLVMEKYLGRLLEKDEVVHHIDGNRTNNSIDNLDVMTKSEHSAIHSKRMWKHIKDLLEKYPYPYH